MKYTRIRNRHVVPPALYSLKRSVTLIHLKCPHLHCLSRWIASPVSRVPSTESTAGALPAHGKESSVSGDGGKHCQRDLERNKIMFGQSRLLSTVKTFKIRRARSLPKLCGLPPSVSLGPLVVRNRGDLLPTKDLASSGSASLLGWSSSGLKGTQRQVRFGQRQKCRWIGCLTQAAVCGSALPGHRSLYLPVWKLGLRALPSGPG